MRRVGPRTAVAIVTAGLLVFAGAGGAHAAGFRAEPGCSTGLLAFLTAEPCPEEGDAGTDPTPPPADSSSDPAGDAATPPASAATPGASTDAAPAADGPDAPAPAAPADPAGMVFTPDPATLTAGTLSIEGLRSFEVVTVALADGSTTRALKITADRVVIGEFGLDVPAGAGGLDTTATTLTVDGNATIWTPSITGILVDGVEHVIDTLSQPDPAALAGLTRLRLPLLGMVADSVAYTGTDQAVY